MCKVCEKAVTLPVAEALVLIESTIENEDGGFDVGHFDDVLDQLLGTSLVDEDPELAEEWERGHRNG